MKFAAIGMLVLSGMAWAAPDLNDTFTALKTATEAKDADQVKKLAPQAAKEAKDLLSKPDTASDVTEFAKGNVEAMVESTKILASGLQEMGSGGIGESRPAETGGLQEPPQPGGLQEPPKELGALQEPPREPGALQEPPQAAGGVQAPPAADRAAPKKLADAKPADQPRLPMPSWLWWMIGVGLLITAAFYWVFNLIRLEIFKMLLGSFFPLAVLILFVLGAIVLDRKSTRLNSSH